ncbi:MAG: PTS lactose/cellobiose transporter subunit IIA [Brevinemataceae bacterium]
MTEEKFEEIVMSLVGFAGEGRSYAFEALRAARNGDFEKSDELLKKSSEALLEAHHTQTELIQDEINGIKTPISLLMLHAQDHLMTALLAKDLIEELIMEKKSNSL